jgi:hypothetical protein
MVPRGGNQSTLPLILSLYRADSSACRVMISNNFGKIQNRKIAPADYVRGRFASADHGLPP